MAKQRSGSGTTEGTDQASAERSLRSEYENRKKDEFLEKELSFPEFKEKAADEVSKAKTKIGEHAAERSYYSNVLNTDLKRAEKLSKLKSARDEADSEVKRETRGKVPGLKKGGSVSSASARADGCAQRGKTRGKIV